MLEVDKNTFQTEVLEADGYVSANSCTFGISAAHGTHPSPKKSTKARRLAIGQKILGLPVMAIYKDGEKVDELVKDDCTPETIEAMIKKYI